MKDGGSKEQARRICKSRSRTGGSTLDIVLSPVAVAQSRTEAAAYACTPCSADTNLVSWPISAFASLRNRLERRLRKSPREYATPGLSIVCPLSTLHSLIFHFPSISQLSELQSHRVSESQSLGVSESQSLRVLESQCRSFDFVEDEERRWIFNNSRVPNIGTGSQNFE